MLQWDEAEEFLQGEAERDLEDGQEVRPCLLAFSGERPLFVAFLRPFPKGGYDQPLIELLALAAPLDADRLALSLSGRAWSLDDPVPPVVPGEFDLRQQVVVIERIDGHARRARAQSTVLPFDVRDGEVTWGEVLRLDDGVGWVPAALTLAVRKRRQLRGSLDQIRQQAVRCVALGHLVGLAPEVADRLGLPTWAPDG